MIGSDAVLYARKTGKILKFELTKRQVKFNIILVVGYPPLQGTIKGPKKFDADAACRQLQEGMQGYGTNEATITEVLTSHTNQQRQDMKLKFQAMYRKDLVKELKSELNFSFEQVVVALLKDPQEYILEDIHEAVTVSS